MDAIRAAVACSHKNILPLCCGWRRAAVRFSFKIWMAYYIDLFAPIYYILIEKKAVTG